MVIKCYNLITEDLVKISPADLYDICLLMYDGVFVYFKEVLMKNRPKGQACITRCQKKLYKALHTRKGARNFEKRLRDPKKYHLIQISGLTYVFRNRNQRNSLDLNKITWEKSEFERVGPYVMLKLATTVIKSIMRCFRQLAFAKLEQADGNGEEDDKGVDNMFEDLYRLLALVPHLREYDVCPSTTFLSIVLQIESDDYN